MFSNEFNLSVTYLYSPVFAETSTLGGRRRPWNDIQKPPRRTWQGCEGLIE